jgi:gamma-glutamyltranspeptidase/glutathione hydrolase
VDAAVAVGYALAVVYPAAGNLGGGGFMTMQLADGRKTFLDFREKAPLAATANMYLDKDGNVVPDLSTATWPWRARHRVGHGTGASKYGTKPRRNDRPGDQTGGRRLRAGAGRRRHAGHATDDSRRTCGFRRDLPAQRRALQVGQKLVQKDLAKTLRPSATRAPTVSTRAGWPTPSSLPARPARASSPRPTSTNTRPANWPVECDYRGYHVVSAPPPSSGGVVICEIMNILEGYPMKDLGFHSAQGMHYQIEAMRHAYVDRNSYLGDPDFVKNPIEHLLDKNYATKPRSDRPNKAGVSAESSPACAPRRQQHHPLFDRRQVGQRGVGDLHPQRLVRCRGDGEQDRGDPQRRDGRLHLKVGVPNMYGLVQGEANAIAPGKRRCRR